jgi:hypothetical protein
MNHRTAASLCVLLATVFSPCSASDTLDRGVVLDRTHGQVVLMLPEGGLEAVDVRSGSSRWKSNDADLPVRIDGQTLLALGGGSKRGVLPFALIAADSGLTRSTGFGTLPTPARVLVDQRLGETFEVKTEVDSGFTWTYSSTATRGALLSAEVEVQPDGATAAVETQDRLAAADLLQLSGSVQIDASQNGLVSSKSASGAGKPAAPIEIGSPSAGGPRSFRSDSGLHILESTPLGNGSYSWALRSSEGTVLGTMESEHAYLPFEVVDSTLLYMRPLRAEFTVADVVLSLPTLIAFDLSAGQVLWQREVRDTTFRGPYPP